MKKIALITGASSGIGKEFAKIHAEKGGDLVIIARNQVKLDALKTELESAHDVNVTVIAKDLTDPKAPQEIYDEVKAANIKVDYLINNAGYGGLGRFDQRDLQTDLNMIQLNVSALTALSHHFLQDFVQRNDGKILNVSSTASLLPGPLQAVYYATKAYVTFFSNAIAEELHDTNITVTNLMPGATETEFASVSGMDKTGLFDKTASARSVAEDGYNAMLKGDLDIISGLTSSQKFMMKMLPFMSKKSILKRVRKMQTVS